MSTVATVESVSCIAWRAMSPIRFSSADASESYPLASAACAMRYANAASNVARAFTGRAPR